MVSKCNIICLLCSYWGHRNGVVLLHCIVALKGKTNSKKVQGGGTIGCVLTPQFYSDMTLLHQWQLTL